MSQKILFPSCISFLFRALDSHIPIAHVKLLSTPSMAHGDKQVIPLKPGIPLSSSYMQTFHNFIFHPVRTQFFFVRKLCFFLCRILIMILNEKCEVCRFWIDLVISTYQLKSPCKQPWKPEMHWWAGVTTFGPRGPKIADLELMPLKMLP